MSRRLTLMAAVAVAVAVAAVGAGYAFLRVVPYESNATLVLYPVTDDPARISTLLDSFDRSGTQGTYVELLASRDTTRRAQSLGVDLTVRAVPDTRAIRLTAKGDADAVRPALNSVISTAAAKQSTLKDLYLATTLESPSAPAKGGPSKSLILAAAAMLALFAGVAVYVALTRLFVPFQGSPIPRGALANMPEPLTRDRERAVARPSSR